MLFGLTKQRNAIQFSAVTNELMKEEKYCLFHNTILLCFGIKVEFKESPYRVICLYTQLIVFVYTIQYRVALLQPFQQIQIFVLLFVLFFPK